MFGIAATYQLLSSDNGTSSWTASSLTICLLILLNIFSSSWKYLGLALLLWARWGVIGMSALKLSQVINFVEKPGVKKPEVDFLLRLVW
jgi:hypothetical protein